jgi:hypothetical protein
MPRKVALYARVSTRGQKLENQLAQTIFVNAYALLFSLGVNEFMRAAMAAFRRCDPGRFGEIAHGAPRCPGGQQISRRLTAGMPFGFGALSASK